MSQHPNTSAPSSPVVLSKAVAPIHRRQFLKRAVMASGIVAVPTLVPSSVLGLNGAVAPSGRIVMAGIGLGNRGTGDLNWMLPEKDVQFVAICDPKRQQRETVKRIIDSKNTATRTARCMRTFVSLWPSGRISTRF
jgi:hypothetical protein